MPDDPNKLTCEAFQNQLSELIGSGADVENHPHAVTCELCSALIRDLIRIAHNFGPPSNHAGTDDWSEST